MTSEFSRTPTTTKMGVRVLLGGALYALALVWGGEWLFAQIHARDFMMGSETSLRWTRTTIAFAPFAGLALYAFIRRNVLSPRRVRLAWATGLVLSLLVWLWRFFDPLFNPIVGANIGLGLLMMASPMPIFLAMWVIARRPDA